MTKRTKRNPGCMILLILAFAFVLPAAFITGMSKELCARAHTFTAQERADMRLDADTCPRIHN